MALTISGCAGGLGNLAANPSPQQLATPEKRRAVTAVAVSDKCARLARQVAPPAYKLNDDARVILKRYEAALETANENIGATGSCIRRLAAEYRGGA